MDYAYQGAAEVSGLPYPRYPRLVPYFTDMDETITKLRILDYDTKAADALTTEAGCVKNAQGLWTLGGEVIGGDLYHPNSLDAIAPAVRRRPPHPPRKIRPASASGAAEEVMPASVPCATSWTSA